MLLEPLDLIVCLCLCLSTGFAKEGRWVQRMRCGDIACFLSGAPTEIVRYDLGTKTFLDPILLDLPPTAFN